MTMERIRVLYVDDEENNLIAFRAYFRKDYEVYTAISAADAFRLLESIEMHIIVSDQRMPEMAGTDFLEKTIDMYPESIRLLITGQSDIDTVIEAINRGQITKYLQKPWDWDTFRIILEHCCDMYLSRKELKVKNALLQKTNDELNLFIYSASHDLRSPLMSILGIVQLAKIDQELQMDGEHLQLIEDNIIKLDLYIKNVIDYYRNSKSIEINDNIDFQHLIKETFDVLKHQNQSVQFETEIEQDEPFSGDTFRFRIILGNLVSNAIKYQNPDATEQKVHVKVKTSVQHVHITISDNGIGILQEHMEEIFKMFFRTYNAKNTQGTGIGLYIVKEALEKIGGIINVESTPLIGTSFHITVPNRRASNG
jgi:two-component system, sensor histidine kinase and response regulator